MSGMKVGDNKWRSERTMVEAKMYDSASALPGRTIMT